MGTSFIYRVPIAISVLLAGLSFAGGLLYILGVFDADPGGNVGRFAVGAALILGSIVVLFGLWIGRRSRTVSGVCLTTGAVFFGICFWWTLLAPLIAVVVALFGMKRVKPAAKEQRLFHSSGDTGVL